VAIPSSSRLNKVAKRAGPFREVHCKRGTARRIEAWLCQQGFDYWRNKSDRSGFAFCFVMEADTAVLLVGEFTGCSLRTEGAANPYLA
jgi:hypothetical protein